MASLFAARLEPLADVIMVGSWAEQIQAVHHNGLILEHPDGRESRHFFAATTAATEEAPADLAIVAVKSWQTERAAQRAQQALSSRGLALTLQNGLGNLEKIRTVVGADRAAIGVTSEGATMLGVGRVRHAGRGHTYFALREDTRLRLEDTAALFAKAGLLTSLVDDAQSLIWGKLVVNAGINPLTALIQKPNGYLVENSVAFDVMSRAAIETAAVAGAMNIELPYPDAAERAAEVARATSANRSSMAQDVARGMPTEVEQITGAVAELGRRVGVITPVNEALLLLVRAQIETGSWSSSIASIPDELQPPFLALASLEKPG
ncbi:MAG: 2-dehydropantoate 2-reductase [Chloroflexota bacterium]|nr:MAG: 2-dehydropantoate 2-reductase [Chloroflexota bacterium]